MQEFASELFTAILATLIVGGITYVARWYWKWLKSGLRQRGFIEIWKRIKSDSYFVARQTTEIMLGVFWIGVTMALLLVLLLYEEKNPTLEDQLLITLLTILAGGLFGLLMAESGCNRKALVFRTRIERKRLRVKTEPREKS